MLSTINWRAARAEVLFFVCILSAFMAFRTAAYGMYHIPSESMLPTLAVGDRILVSKFSYGYSRHSIPFSLGPEIHTPTGRLFGRLPERGDLVVFKHPENGETLIKRVVGLPGDTIEIAEGRLYINGALTSRVLDATLSYREHRGGVSTVGRFTEALPQGPSHEIYERGDHRAGDDYGPAIVPDNRLFVMGDNRDNSRDSRFAHPGVGFLPVENLVGRADVLLFSLYHARKEDGLATMKRKWFSRLN